MPRKLTSMILSVFIPPMRSPSVHCISLNDQVLIGAQLEVAVVVYVVESTHSSRESGISNLHVLFSKTNVFAVV